MAGWGADWGGKGAGWGGKAAVFAWAAMGSKGGGGGGCDPWSWGPEWAAKAQGWGSKGTGKGGGEDDWSSWGPGKADAAAKGKGKSDAAAPAQQQQQEQLQQQQQQPLQQQPKAPGKGGPKGFSPPEERAQISPERHGGKLVDWKGKFGWIQPDKPIQHPAAAKHNGKVFLSHNDMVGEVPAVGTRLTYLVYCDKTGLGAMKCSISIVPAGGGPQVAKSIAKAPLPAGPAGPQTVPSSAKMPVPAAPKEKEAYLAAKNGTRRTISPGAITGEVSTWVGNVARIRPWGSIPHPSFKGEIDCHKCDVQDSELPRIGAQVSFHVCLSGVVLGAERLTVTKQPAADAPGVKAAPPKASPKAMSSAAQLGAGAKAIAAPPKAQAAPAPAMNKQGERKRISEVRTTGEVQRWQNSYGWIEVHAPLDSPKAKRDGTIFVGKSDLIGMSQLVPGQLVQFHVYMDNTGLGAEECSLF